MVSLFFELKKLASAREMDDSSKRRVAKELCHASDFEEISGEHRERSALN